MTYQQPTRVAEIVDAVKELATNTVELAKAELTPAAKKATVGGGLFAAAATFALHALWMILIAVALLVGWLYQAYTSLTTWPAFIWGFVTVAIISLLIAAILALIGAKKIEKIKKPEATIAEINTTVNEISALMKKSDGSSDLPWIEPNYETEVTKN
ncbi:MAG: hypothetical protein CR979_01860 [Propionibacterium sp.]|nr:MAG: hypothetical protein CR979_01860 [Propionibacterium sp.]